MHFFIHIIMLSGSGSFFVKNSTIWAILMNSFVSHIKGDCYKVLLDEVYRRIFLTLCAQRIYALVFLFME